MQGFVQLMTHVVDLMLPRILRGIMVGLLLADLKARPSRSEVADL